MSANSVNITVELMDAVITGDIQRVEALFEKGANPNSICRYEYENPFSTAGSGRRYNDSEQGSPFLTACVAGYNEIVDVFLEYGVDANLRIGNVSPLKQAVAGCFDTLDVPSDARYLRTIKLLIKSGAILDKSVDNQRIAPLPYAIESYFSCMNYYNNPFGIREKSPDKRLIKILLEYGAPTLGIVTFIKSLDEEFVRKNYYEEIITLVKTTEQLCIHCDEKLPRKGIFSFSKKCKHCGIKGYS